MKHLLQSTYWKEVKKALGNKVYDFDGGWFQTTKLPLVNKFVGYIPRIDLKTFSLDSLVQEAKKANCISVSIDPSNLNDEEINLGKSFKIVKGRATQMQNNVVISLDQSDEDLLKNMKQKHRYNIKVAEKHNVRVEISDSENALQEFLKLHGETVSRQKYKDRNNEYLKTVWSTLKNNELEIADETPLDIKIATAYFENKALASWMIIGYGETLYYPYGGSSDENRNVMATYLLVWEVMKWGKNNTYKYLDTMGVQEDKSDGYSRFKSGFGGAEIKYKDTIDLVIDPLYYKTFKTLSFVRNF